MKKTIEFIFAFLLFVMVGTLFAACAQRESITYASKVHSDDNLIQKECHAFDDGVSVDYYEQLYGYYYLSGTEDLLLRVDPIPELWDYEEARTVMSQEAKAKMWKTVESLHLYDLDRLLEQAYQDYCNCRDSEHSDKAFQNHVLLIDASVSVHDDVLTCDFDNSKAPEGHFEGELISEQQSCSFSVITGEAI